MQYRRQIGNIYRVDRQDEPQEMERNYTTAKHVAWFSCAWLLLSFFPYHVGHPVHPLCTVCTFLQHILIWQVAHNETVEFCHTPLVKDCNIQGPIECVTEYESICETRQGGHFLCHSYEVPCY